MSSRLLRAGSLVALAGCLGCGASATPTEPTTSHPATANVAPPDLGQLRALLAPLHARVFTADEEELGCTEGQSLGEYLAMLDENTEPDPGDPTRVIERTGGCGITIEDGMWPAPDPALWLCTVRAHIRDAEGESPWTYELRIRVRRADAAIDTRWIACPGTP